MGRKSKYETHVKPHLKDIPKWYETQTEAQICKRLKISHTAWEKYKNEYPELTECLRYSKESYCEELKSILKQKAKGIKWIEEKKRVYSGGDLDGTGYTDYTTKYVPPDVGAIHLLLKNLDENWHNDDKATLEIKRKQTEIAEKKANPFAQFMKP